MMRRIAIFLLLSACVTISSAQEALSNGLLEAPTGTYVLEKTHASLLWEVTHKGMSTYTAKFTRFDVTLFYDAKLISNSSVDATVDITSIETDYPQGLGRDFDAELRGTKFFNALSFPKAIFHSQSVQQTGERTLVINGQLTLLGITRPLVLTATLNGARKKNPFVDAPWLGFSAHGALNRKDFGLDPMPELLGVGSEVIIIINAEFVGK